MTLSVNSPAEIAVHLFQRMVRTAVVNSLNFSISNVSFCIQGLRCLLLTRRGRLEGMLTKTDVHDHLSADGQSSARADLMRRRQEDLNASLGYNPTSSQPPGDVSF